MSKLPTAKPNEPLTSFKLCKNTKLGDPNGSGKVLEGDKGHTVKLTKKQAQFLMNQPSKMIEVDLDDLFEETENEKADDTEAEKGDKSEPKSEDKSEPKSEAKSPQSNPTKTGTKHPLKG